MYQVPQPLCKTSAPQEVSTHMRPIRGPGNSEERFRKLQVAFSLVVRPAAYLSRHTISLFFS